MKFGVKEKMRSIMFSNYPYGQTFKTCFRFSFYEFWSIYCWILTKITISIFRVWKLVWLVKTRNIILKIETKKSKERRPIISRNSKLDTTRTMLRWLSLKNSHWWSWSRMDTIQIKLENRLNFTFENIFYLKINKNSIPGCL